MGSLVSSYAVEVAQCPKTSLVLSGRDLSNSDARSIADGLTKNTKLTSLDLSQNKINDKGASALLKALKQNSTLIKLKLHDNDIRSALIGDINYLLSKNNIQRFTTIIEQGVEDEINLEFKDVSNEDCGALVSALKSCRPIKGLRLGFNEFDAKGCDSLGGFVSSELCLLTYLHLSGNAIGDEGGRVLGRAIVENQTIQELLLNNASIGSAGACGLAEGLARNSTLKDLFLWGNSIGDEGVAALASALKTNSTLLSLDAKENAIGDDGGKAIGEMLAVNSTLTFLDLEGNCIGSAGNQAIAKGLYKSPAIAINQLLGIDLSSERCLQILNISTARLKEIEESSSLSTFKIIEILKEVKNNIK